MAMLNHSTVPGKSREARWGARRAPRGRDRAARIAQIASQTAGGIAIRPPFHNGPVSHQNAGPGGRLRKAQRNSDRGGAPPGGRVQETANHCFGSGGRRFHAIRGYDRPAVGIGDIPYFLCHPLCRQSIYDDGQQIE
jgi:hypothetical protein